MAAIHTTGSETMATETTETTEQPPALLVNGLVSGWGNDPALAETWTDAEITEWARSIEAAYMARFYTAVYSTD